MPKPLLIKRIDLIAHPFFKPEKEEPVPYSREQAKKLLEVWKGQVDKAAEDPNRLLFISQALRQTKWQEKLSKALIKYARRKLGQQFGFFELLKRHFCFRNSTGEKFSRFEDFLGRRFKVNPKRVKTRGFGEYTNSCVVRYLTQLNLYVGLEDPIPYRNRQSTLLARKSVGADFKPWELKELMKSPVGRDILRKKAKKYAWRRREIANLLAKKLYGEKNFYKPRTHLKKRKP